MSLAKKRKYTDIATSGDGDDTTQLSKRQRCDTECIYISYLNAIPIELLLLITTLIQDSFGVIYFAEYCRDFLNIDVMTPRDWVGIRYIRYTLSKHKDFNPCCYLYNHTNNIAYDLTKDLIMNQRSFYEAWLWTFRYNRKYFISATNFLFDKEYLKTKTYCCKKMIYHRLQKIEKISLLLCITDEDEFRLALQTQWGYGITYMFYNLSNTAYWSRYKNLYRHIPDKTFLLFYNIRRHLNLLHDRTFFELWCDFLINFGRVKLLNETVQLVKEKGFKYSTLHWSPSRQIRTLVEDINGAN